jgi:hypothetical protein
MPRLRRRCCRTTTALGFMAFSPPCRVGVFVVLPLVPFCAVLKSTGVPGKERLFGIEDVALQRMFSTAELPASISPSKGSAWLPSCDSVYARTPVLRRGFVMVSPFSTRTKTIVVPRAIITNVHVWQHQRTSSCSTYHLRGGFPEFEPPSR